MLLVSKASRFVNNRGVTHRAGLVPVCRLLVSNGNWRQARFPGAMILTWCAQEFRLIWSSTARLVVGLELFDAT